ncbi:MAG: hypothetical protein IJC35_01745 [Oscillospiraceae bacterium]|nr:hypothetical protein [Oscillospiraceae bacterium]
MERAPEKILEVNKDGTDLMFWERHTKPNSKRTFIIPKSEITSIQFTATTVRKLFKKIDTEIVTIVTRMRFEPFMIYAHEEKHYEEYKQILKDFAKKNMLTCRESK